MNQARPYLDARQLRALELIEQQCHAIEVAWLSIQRIIRVGQVPIAVSADISERVAVLRRAVLFAAEFNILEKEPDHENN